ncbi:PLP-dependent transferase [Dacryopinax primogenitus]|uniref:sphinganine-1-phosphate aldolase n=1 Tax=Dacryopinax primogenitus (strain DJM 731) TaxID=1858805 RepID=M5GFI7_DACPD|nr:PLP-dependent transferase [Dacryopinax primogenitus]EJU04158.1 PLP-dependent transferase [Dacryopinax primogenitus]
MSSQVVRRTSQLPWKAIALTLKIYDQAKSSVFWNVFWNYVLVRAFWTLRAKGFAGVADDAKTWILELFTKIAFRIPPIKRKIDKEMAKVRDDIEAKIAPRGPGIVRHLAIPLEGKTPKWIEDEMERMDKQERGDIWKEGKMSGGIYHGGEELNDLLVAAFKKFVVSNPLHPDVFPTIRRMDAEIVAMCLRMYNNPSGAGTTTSGGTESILMSCKAHRDWGRAVKGIKDPEIVVPVSAHAAFYKAAAYFKMKVQMIPVDLITRKVDIERVRRAINPNTVLIVGSAVNFPDGCMDDIGALAKMAKKHKVGMHVDCCLGSFIMPFLEKAGYPVDPFDFRLEGITAISCDTHKYGFAPKGTSVIMYRDAELRTYQYFSMPSWPGGLYGSPSMAGSRGGAVLAGCWAAMQYMGQDGYLKSCKEIVGCRRQIELAIRDDIPELEVLGEPCGPVVAFTSDIISPMEVGDAMGTRGWHLNALNGPPAVHIACTRLTVPNVEQFIADLKDAVAEVKANPSKNKGTMVALYGLGQSTAIGPALVTQVANAYLDTMYLA